jgi:hypothetical protein
MQERSPKMCAAGCVAAAFVIGVFLLAMYML